MTSRNWGQCCTCNFQEGSTRGSACTGTRADLGWRKPLRDVEGLMRDFRVLMNFGPGWISHVLCEFMSLFGVACFPRLFWCLSTPFNESLRWFGCSRDWIFSTIFFKIFQAFSDKPEWYFLWTEFSAAWYYYIWSGSQKWRGGPVNWSNWETPWLVTILWTSLYMIQCTSSHMFLFEQEGYIRLRSCSPAKVIFPIWISLCVRLSVYRFSAT